MQLDHAHDHRAPRIKGKILVTPRRVEAVDTVIASRTSASRANIRAA
jgi:hypothetical protein